jgi:ABC-type sugar transport system ATPase subunit
MKETDDRILIVEGVSKRFGGVQALDNVDLDLRRGEVHALVGENGAGKSTLMNIIGGVVQRDDGRILFDDREVNFASPTEAQEMGIAVIHQELSMLPDLNVVENVCMGGMLSRFGWLDWSGMRARTEEALEMVGLDVHPRTLVRELDISQRQRVEIAKALSQEASLIIMDEPNSSLSQAETERLFEVIERLKKNDVSIIYVSHKIEEVLRIADRISVLRDGRYIGTLDKAQATADRIINMMVGRELQQVAAPSERDRTSDEVLLEVKQLSGRGFRDVTFNVRRGEIVGLAGLVGAGRSETARAIFGAEPHRSGEIYLEGRRVNFRSPNEAIGYGLAMLPEDRKELSLFMEHPVRFNMSLAQLPRISRLGIVNGGQEKRIATTFADDLDIRMAGLDAPVRSLSGGNQQKVVLARWLATRPEMLILDEPTHGVDVGAKAEIYRLMRRLAEEGVGILLISSELPVILAMSDRIVVMHEGRITGILDCHAATEDKVMACATGLDTYFEIKEM